MRRPVKPFVTEYKGNGRRAKETRAEAEPEDGKRKASEGKAKDASPPAKRGATSEARSPLPPRGLFRGSADPEPTDSYEAAMRAADALFSPRAASGRASSGQAGSEQPATAGASPPKRAEGRSSDGADAAQSASGEPAGRVLRALDEPAPPEPMPEPAPKRRGRKPGSLNKPKAPGLAGRRAAKERAFAAPPTAPLDGVPEAALDVAEDDAAEDMAGMEAPSPQGAQADGGQGPGIALSEPRQRDRFSWVRTKLRPGEKWKRRLPRIAW